MRTTRRMCGRAMLARTGSQGSGVERIVPVMVLIVEFNWASTWCLWDDLDQTGAQYSAAENARAIAEVCRVGAAAPHFEPASLLRRLFLDFTLAQDTRFKMVLLSYA